MIKDNSRLCDICDEVIPRGIVYRCGYTNPDVLRSSFSDAPELLQTFIPEPDGAVRLDVSAECAASGKMIKLTEDAVDALH